MTEFLAQPREDEEPTGFEFYVEGHPSADHRPRKSGKHFHKSPAYDSWVNSVGWQAKAAGISKLGGHLLITLVFFISRFKQTDIDNLAKGVLDGLQGIGFEDDNQVTGLIIMKSRASETEGVYVSAKQAFISNEIWDQVYEHYYAPAHKCNRSS